MLHLLYAADPKTYLGSMEYATYFARHHVIPEEIEELCHQKLLIFRGQQKGRLVLIGSTEGDRMLTVILETKGKGIYYPVTVYPTDPHDITLYKNLRGGENNEKK